MLYFLTLLSLLSFSEPKPNIILISVDTLRADRLGIYGYSKNTSPNIDALLAKGIVFDDARTPEPLTAPALISMLTSKYPHQHGATRNGLAHRKDLPSLPKSLKAQGYATAAFVGNWTLKDRLTGLGTHFDDYREVLDKKRWFGLFLGEADGSDLTETVLEWMAAPPDNPYFLWVHYADPHAPYVFQKDYAKRLGLGKSANRSQRYDTEIAFVDEQIGRLLRIVENQSNTMIIFTADHGESLGEHNYWGHGRHLYDATLKIPMGIVWEGVLKSGRITAPASLLDLAPTISRILGHPPITDHEGFDWNPVIQGSSEGDNARVLYFQAHRGAVQTRKGERQGRLKGLLEVARLENQVKEIYRIRSRKRRVFDLKTDAAEVNNTVALRSKISPELHLWAAKIEKLLQLDLNEDAELQESDIEMLRSLGYID